MKASDTVMTAQELGKYWLNPEECDDTGIAQDQAEISFKAGIKEVVEWLERTKKQKVPKYKREEWGLE